MFKIACLILLLIMEFPFVAKFIKARKDFDIIKQQLEPNRVDFVRNLIINAGASIE